MFFTKSPKPLYPNIKLKEKQLTFSTSHKFLGVIFDSKLQWHPHIENIYKKMQKKTKFFKVPRWNGMGQLIEIPPPGL